VVGAGLGGDLANFGIGLFAAYPTTSAHAVEGVFKKDKVFQFKLGGFGDG